MIRVLKSGYKFLLMIAVVCRLASADSDAASSAFLVIDEEAMYSTFMFRDYKSKVDKFLKALEEARARHEKKLRDGLIAIEDEKDPAAKKIKEAAWIKKKNEYNQKLEEINAIGETVSKQAIAEMQKVHREVLVAIAAKYNNKPVLFTNGAPYIPSHYTNISEEFIRGVNKLNKKISLALPVIAFEK